MPTAFDDRRPMAGPTGSGPATSAADEDGYLVIRGRSKELIISGGFNVYPTEVEDVLAGHPAVAEVAVTGTPSDEWGEVVTAWVVADGAAAGHRATSSPSAAASLAPYKRPRLRPRGRRAAPQRAGQGRPEPARLILRQ